MIYPAQLYIQLTKNQDFIDKFNYQMNKAIVELRITMVDENATETTIQFLVNNKF